MTSCRKQCQCKAFGCDMPICRQVCQCGGVTGGPEVAETCGATEEGEGRNGGGEGTKDIPDDQIGGGNATSPMQPMPDGNATGGDDRGFTSSNNPTQSMPPVPAPTPRRPPVPSPPAPCHFFCGSGQGGTISTRNRNGDNNPNEQQGSGPGIESDEDESFDLSYLYDLLRKYAGYDVMMDSGSANKGTLAVASDTNIAEADAAVKN